jgi:hypothetical protein
LPIRVCALPISSSVVAISCVPSYRVSMTVPTS